MSMRRNFQRCLLAATVLATATPAFAAGIYSELVIPLGEKRPYTQSYDKAKHALVLTFRKTSPNELGAFDHYDERLIKRVLIKDLGPAGGTEVRLFLRDRDVRAVVSHFSEPYRVAIDLFDADYEEEHDKVTGMPLVATQAQADEAGESVHPARGPFKLLAPNGDEATHAEDDGSRRPVPPPAPGRRRLLQPIPELFTSIGELKGALSGAADGIGKSWRTYPRFVNRLQLAPYEAGKVSWRQPPTTVLNSAEAMASYAGQLFDLGNEAKALVAYEQVLQKEPAVFDRNAVHLFKFAEAHLGQGNLVLASGYYQALIDKHPGSPLAAFARLRLLDIEAIQMLAQGKYAEWPTLLPRLAKIRTTGGEIQTQIAIRRAFWSPLGMAKAYDKGHLPEIDSDSAADLAHAYAQHEPGTSTFLAGSLLLGHMLAPSTPWQRSSGNFAEGYFKHYDQPRYDPYRTILKERLYAKLNQTLQADVADGELIKATSDYEALPASLKGIQKNPKTAWELAEAYRKLGHTEKAVDLYAAAALTDEDGPARFKAKFWLSVTAGELATSLDKTGGSKDRVARLKKQSRAADHDAETAWNRLKDDERAQLAVAYKEPFEKTIQSPAHLVTGPKILLSEWTKALSPTTPGKTPSDAGELSRAYSPSGSAVTLLTDLGKRFGELGLPTARRKALGLLKQIKPKDLGDDRAARAIWTKELIDLAEDYRKSNEYLAAGRLYSQVGDGTTDGEGRAEALYKGGLLLYRAGRRAEATQAFEKAAGDGNNVFYANLAKERLSQLK